MPRMVTAASVAVAVRCVGTACTTAPSPTAVVLDLQEQQGVSVHPRSPRRAAEAGAGPARAVMLRLSGTSARARRYRRPSPPKKARRRTSDPVLARHKCPLGGPFGHSRSTCARSPPPMGAQSRPPRPVLGGRGGYSAQEPPSGVAMGRGQGRRAYRRACQARGYPPFSLPPCRCAAVWRGLRRPTGRWRRWPRRSVECPPTRLGCGRKQRRASRPRRERSST